MIKDKVEILMLDYQRARDDDDFLYTMYIYTHHSEHLRDLDGHWFVNILAKILSYETIRRCRQKLQEDDKKSGNNIIQPSEACTRRRIKQQGKIKEMIDREDTGAKEIAEQDKHLRDIKQEVLALR